MFYVYVLRSKKDHQFYTGYTGDLKRRLSEHHRGLSEATKPRKPFELIYYEAYIHEEDAQRRERYLKTGMGKRDLRKRLHRTLNTLVGATDGSNGVSHA